MANKPSNPGEFVALILLACVAVLLIAGTARALIWMYG